VRETDNYPVAYWPCEDAQGSLSLASAVGGAPMTIVGKPNLASYSGFEAAAPIPTLAKDSWTGKVPAYSVTNKSQIRFIMHLPEVKEDTDTDSGVVAGSVIMCIRSTGRVNHWHLKYQTD